VTAFLGHPVSPIVYRIIDISTNRHATAHKHNERACICSQNRTHCNYWCV